MGNIECIFSEKVDVTCILDVQKDVHEEGTTKEIVRYVKDYTGYMASV
jgi:hypothetical protein